MLKAIAGNAQHIGARQEQQDSFAFSNQGDAAFLSHGGFLGVVADGMGGLVGGHEASSSAVDAFLATYRRKKPGDSIPATLYRSLEEANCAVLAAARKIGAEGNAGTTLAAVVVRDDQLYWVSAGDSRIYLLREGQLVRVNEDHSYAMSLWPLVAAGSMEREAAREDLQAQHLTSHLGMETLALVDIAQRPFLLQPEDTVIVCSDGIYRAVSDEEIVKAFQQSTPAKACEALQAAVLAKANSRQDNLTVIAICCQQEGSTARSSPLTATRKKTFGPFLAAALAVEIAATAGLGAVYAIKLKRELDAQNAAHGQHVPASSRRSPMNTLPPTPSTGAKTSKPPAGKPALPPPTAAGLNPGDADGEADTAEPEQSVAPAEPAANPRQGNVPATPSQAAPPTAPTSHGHLKPGHAAPHETTPKLSGGWQ